MIQEFIDYQRKGRQLSLRTCEEYAKDLKYFAIWAKEQGLTWSTIQTHDLMAYQEACSELCGTTINKRLTAIRSLYTWMMAQGMTNNNPALNVQSVRTHIQRREVVQKDYDHYLTERSKTREELDAKMLYALLLETGCRIGEVLDLRLDDFHVNDLCITVTGKGNKTRRVYYGKRTAYMIQQRQAWCSDARLFEQYTSRHFRYILSKYFDTHEQHLHPHLLRHTFASRMYSAGMPLKDISVLLGHSSQRTTERYLQVSDEHIASAYMQYQF